MSYNYIFFVSISFYEFWQNIFYVYLAKTIYFHKFWQNIFYVYLAKTIYFR